MLGEGEREREGKEKWAKKTRKSNKKMELRKKNRQKKHGRAKKTELRKKNGKKTQKNQIWEFY